MFSYFVSVYSVYVNDSMLLATHDEMNVSVVYWRRQMPVSHDGQLTIEKTPSYLITRDVPRRVKQMSRSVRLIVILRDPVTRALSDYTQANVKRRRAMPTFEQLAFIDAGGGGDNATSTVNTSWRAIQIGLYAVHVRSPSSAPISCTSSVAND